MVDRDRMEYAENLLSGPAHAFAGWETTSVPNGVAGAYTIFDGARFLYVGIAGRSGAATSEKSRRTGLLGRLDSHASGRRSGDQFCVYVFDRLVLPTMTADGIRRAAHGEPICDALVRAYVRERLSYRFVTMSTYAEAQKIEAELRLGRYGPAPLLNPKSPRTQDAVTARAVPADPRGGNHATL